MSRALCVVTDEPLPKSFPIEVFYDLAAFRSAETEDGLLQAIREADVLYSWQVPTIVPHATPRLRWIALPSAGADHLQDSPVWTSDILITSSKGIHVVPMAEHVFALLLGLVRQIPNLVRAQDEHTWLKDGGGMEFGELRGKTMGIIGWGKIGDGVAHLAGAFGMRVIGTRGSAQEPLTIQHQSSAYSDPPWLEPVDLLPDVVYPPADLGELMESSDVVVTILPVTSRTRGLLGETEFQHAKPGALFINIGRGPVVDEAALIRALMSGRLSGAGLDVFPREPLSASSPLWSMTNVIISPHVGGTSPHTSDRAASFFAVNLMRYLDGEPLLNVVQRDRQY